MKKLGLVVVFLVAAVVCFGAGQSEDGGKEFPSRTVENIFPWGPGGALSKSQIIAKALGDELGEAVTVISTPGAAGTKAFQTAMNRPADGYTIIDGYVAPLVLQPLLGNADWTYEDFKPLSAGVAHPFSIGCKVGETRWSNFEELMEYGKKHPGELRYTSDSRNNLPHMVIAKVLQAYGVVAQNVPYEPSDARKDIKAGVLDFGFVGVADYAQDPEGFEILLVLSELPESKEAFQGAPTIADLGIDLGISGLGPMGWDWWLVHPDTPEEETEILREAMARAMAREDVIESIENLGSIALQWGPEEYEEKVGSVKEQLASMKDALAWEREALAEIK
ncbi:MAG: tripartite tricarboxylate transporter substrate binding protein [Spirochaetia bacterium]|nr:tripartite tricarboxylate transporter substrate binding protein [Spirochaetia bacterium]